MNLDDYQSLALRTASGKQPLIHAALGITGEAGEFADAIKRHVIYGQQLNEDNALEELGDLLWYIALACDALGWSMDTIAARNIRKLRVRYPEKYTELHAALRLDKRGEE